MIVDIFVTVLAAKKRVTRVVNRPPGVRMIVIAASASLNFLNSVPPKECSYNRKKTARHGTAGPGTIILPASSKTFHAVHDFFLRFVSCFVFSS